ncbi:4Fe-4S binding protein [candidate division WOR-3 bacterium]|nr:4Fe-4S binding protein [candidate division WOR-3 bacterium]
MSKKTWKEIDIASIINKPGSARDFKTGDWRSQKPVWNEDKCKQCLICWVYCPDSAITVKDEKMTGINLDYCKGCGICAVECPFKAIEMVEEKK